MPQVAALKKGYRTGRPEQGPAYLQNPALLLAPPAARNTSLGITCTQVGQRRGIDSVSMCQFRFNGKQATDKLAIISFSSEQDDGFISPG